MTGEGEATAARGEKIHEVALLIAGDPRAGDPGYAELLYDQLAGEHGHLIASEAFLRASAVRRAARAADEETRASPRRVGRPLRERAAE